uniref:NADH-ubiquinone oxidoreductase chain 5 n=1 Tax=Cyanophora paradoxa TaxID=2762 RepID=E9P1E6_CYAPA|nr:NADH dehydrogenase subunit 5 [Cyanophora paradoxa]ADW79198.1 NADH dehydrogenase subunit 5 [Cyanophora paradoxa]
MYLTLVFLPLISALVAFFVRFIGNKYAAYICTSLLGFTFILSIKSFYYIALLQNSCYIQTLPWLFGENLIVFWGFLFDSVTCTMLIVVTSISFLVHFYSIEYMGSDPHLGRFMSYLSFFTFFMLILVTADNMVQMFVGWEGVGLCSYLLINFFFNRIQANKAALKAMVMNRIGDFGLSLGIMALFYVCKSLDYHVIFSSILLFVDNSFYFFNIKINLITCICLLLFIGAVGKSAQIGLHTWLPDAMEGPTPVSALIHAATMVTAGVFLIIRCSFLFEFSETALDILTILGALTAFFAATTGLLQNDAKRVIAYSTCSQLGYMVFVCGISGYSTSLFHLANHAFFKALLFLTAGSLIHAVHDEQDFRKMGGLAYILPFSYSMLLVGSLSLTGFPFLTGFYSKDMILELTFSTYLIKGTFAYILGVLSAFCTAFYSFRLIFWAFLAKPNGYKHTYSHASESNFFITFPLGVLALASIFVGYLFRDMFIGVGTSFWNNSIFILPENNFVLESEFIPVYNKLTPVVFSFGGLIIAFCFYNFLIKKIFIVKIFYIKFYTFLNKRWYFDKIYNEFIALPIISFGYKITFKFIDRGILEIFGPTGLITNFTYLSKNISSIQSGLMYHYLFIILLGITITLFTVIVIIQKMLYVSTNLVLIFILAVIGSSLKN